MARLPPWRLHTDGAARGNPGPAGIGVVLIDPHGQVAEQLARYIGTATNNVAEYTALIAGLERALARGARPRDVYSHSQLVVGPLPVFSLAVLYNHVPGLPTRLPYRLATPPIDQGAAPG